MKSESRTPHRALIRGLLLILAFPIAGQAFQKGDGGGTVGPDPDFHKLLREREMARDKASQEFMQQAEQTPDDTIRVKVRKAGDGAGSRGEVIAESTLSPEEFANEDWNEVHTRVRSENGLTVVPEDATSARPHLNVEISSTARNVNWALGALIGLAAIGWWHTRRQELT